MAKSRAKTGPLTMKEKAYILERAGKVPAATIAMELSRAESTIEKFIDENWLPPGAAPSEARLGAGIRQELRESIEWARLKDEFSDSELELFEEQYVALMKQFKNDVFASEETQIFQVIKLNILMSRNLIARKNALKDIARMEEICKDFLKHKGTPGTMNESDRDYFMNLSNQLQAAKSSEQAKTAEYDKLQNTHIKMMEKLKATRDQRIKEIEESRETFMGLLKQIQKRQVAEKEGRLMDLFRLAGENEYRRLSQPHKYADGMIDLPVLSADSIEQYASTDDTDEEEDNDV